MTGSTTALGIETEKPMGGAQGMETEPSGVREKGSEMEGQFNAFHETAQY